MLYTKRPNSPPITDKPMAARESRVYEPAAAPLLFEELGLEEEDVLLPPMVVGSFTLPSQVFFPWIMPWLLKLLIAVQSISAVLWTFTAPTTLVRPDKSGVVKFPDRSIAPAT